MNVRLFAPRIPAVLLAAALAEVSGAVGTAIARQALGISGVGSTGLVDRLLFVAFALVPATVTLSIAFTGRWWSRAETTVAAIGTILSFALGPLFLALIGPIGHTVLGDDWLRIRGSELGTDPIWGVAIFVAFLPLEYYTWESLSPVRTRNSYGRLTALVRGMTSGDTDRARKVRTELRTMERVATAGTNRLVVAVSNWFNAWLDNPDGLDESLFGPLAADIRREMTALYGPPIDPMRW